MLKEAKDRDSDTIRFIGDRPAEEDFFSTHSEIARALATAIPSNPTLKIIGLLGRWGSGKSTVIKHATIELEQSSASPAFKVFAYDAWLHQSDPLRRSFLESLLDFLLEKKLIVGGDWAEKVAELNGSVQHEDTVETPILTTDAKLIAFSLIGVPFGASLISLDTLKESFGTDWTRAGFDSLILAVALMSMPILTWLVRMIYLKWKGKAFSWFPPILSNSSLTKTYTRRVSSREPSSIEFGKVFRDIMLEVSKNGNRLVIVIDNIDRVIDAEALKMWSSIRSFFLAAHEENILEYEPYHPIVILPVDFEAIKSVFSKSEDSQRSEEASISFLNKTFDITFDVSEPVMSDWRAFLAKQLSFSLGKHVNQNNIFWITRFFESYINKNEMAVTPRSINKAVNSISSLLLQWKDSELHIESIAYFSIFKKDISAEYLRYTEDSPDALWRVVKDWKLELSALYFGVPLDKAAQVLITKPLEKAIISGDLNESERLSKIHGFGTTFEQLTATLPQTEQAVAPSFQVVTNAALILAQISRPDQPWTAPAWQNLARAYLDVVATTAPSEDIDKRIWALGSHINKAGLQPFAATTGAILNRLLALETLDHAQFSAICRASAELVRRELAGGLPPSQFLLNGEPVEVLLRAAGLADHEISKSLIRTGLPAEEAVAALSQIVNREDAREAAPQLIAMILSGPESGLLAENVQDWSMVANAAAGIARSEELRIASLGIEVLLQLSPVHAPTRDLINQLVDEGAAKAVFDRAYASRKLEPMASSLAMMIQRPAMFSAPAGTVWSILLKQFPGLIERTINELQTIVKGPTLGVLHESYLKNVLGRDIIEAIVSYQIKNDRLGDIYLQNVLNNIDSYLRMVPYYLRNSFADRLSNYTNFWDQLKEAPIDNKLADLAKRLAAGGGEQRVQVKSLISERLLTINKTDWQSALGEQTPISNLLLLFAESERLFANGSELEQALLESATDGDLRKIEKDGARWLRFTRHISKSGENAVFAALGQRMLALQSSKLLLALLSLPDRRMISKTRFSKMPSRAVQSAVIPFLDTRAGRDWLAKHKRVVEGVISDASIDVQSKLRIALDSLSSSKVETRHKWYEQHGRKFLSLLK